MKEKLETPRTDEAYCDAMRSLDGGSSIVIDQMRALAQQLEHELYIREISCKCDMEAWDRDRKWWREQLAACQRRCAELERDAGRYCWLRGVPLLRHDCFSFDGLSLKQGSDLDAALTALRASAAPGAKGESNV